VGTKLDTAFDQPALGAVYKLSAVRESNGEWRFPVKLSEQTAKISTPGILGVRRFVDDDGRFRADMIYDEEMPPQSAAGVIVDPADSLHMRSIDPGWSAEELVLPALRNGLRAGPSPTLAEIRERARCQIASLHPAIRRLLNPHVYPVGLEYRLHHGAPDRSSSAGSCSRRADSADDSPGLNVDSRCGRGGGGAPLLRRSGLTLRRSGRVGLGFGVCLGIGGFGHLLDDRLDGKLRFYLCDDLDDGSSTASCSAATASPSRAAPSCVSRSSIASSAKGWHPVSSSAGRAPGAGGPDGRPREPDADRLELFVGVDRETQCATGLGDCDEIDRAEFRGETARAAALCLMRQIVP